MKQILIVDDNVMVRKALRLFIATQDDFEVIGDVATAEEAIIFCDTHQPDVVLMDLVMPTMSGLEAIRVIHQRQPHIHIIALTSYESNTSSDEARRAGATAYVVKDISMDELAGIIREPTTIV